jgi:hypothetical protein
MLVELPHWPTAPAEVTWKLRQPSQANRSEFTGARRVTILAEAPRYTAQVKYPPIIGREAFRPWRVALAMMQGRANTFRLGAGEGAQRGVGQPVVDGAGQIGTVLHLRGCYPRAYARAGWSLTVDNRLHEIVTAGFADGDGKLTISVIPYVAGIPDGAKVEMVRPYGLMSLSDDEVGWTVGPGQKYDVAFNCEEAF